MARVSHDSRKTRKGVFVLVHIDDGECFMNHAFNRLDDCKASLRILIMLISGLELASRGQLEAALDRLSLIHI